MREDINMRSEEFRKIGIQEKARTLLEAALNKASPRVKGNGDLIWNTGIFSSFVSGINNYTRFQEEVENCIKELEKQYRPERVRLYVKELLDRLLEKYKKDNGYQSGSNEKNSPETLKDLHHHLLKKELQNKVDLESRVLQYILTQCGPTSIVVRNVQNYLEQKEGRNDFSKDEMKGIEQVKTKIADVVERMRRPGHASFPFASGSSGAESSEPPKVDVTAQSLELK